MKYLFMYGMFNFGLIEGLLYALIVWFVIKTVSYLKACIKRPKIAPPNAKKE